MLDYRSRRNACVFVYSQERACILRLCFRFPYCDMAHIISVYKLIGVHTCKFRLPLLRFGCNTFYSVPCSISFAPFVVGCAAPWGLRGLFAGLFVGPASTGALFGPVYRGLEGSPFGLIFQTPSPANKGGGVSPPLPPLPPFPPFPPALYMHICMCVLPTYINACTHSHIPVCTHTQIHIRTYTHTHIHTYIHTYIHTDIHV